MPAEVLLAVEVVSPSSRRMDRLVKPAVLAEAGVPACRRAGETAVVDVPFPVELRPAELAGPRSRG